MAADVISAISKEAGEVLEGYCSQDPTFCEERVFERDKVTIGEGEPF